MKFERLKAWLAQAKAKISAAQDRLIDEWRKSYKLMSIWVFSAIIAFPDIYDAIALMNWMEELPTPAKWAIRVMGAIGVAVRLIRQTKKGLER